MQNSSLKFFFYMGLLNLCIFAAIWGLVKWVTTDSLIGFWLAIFGYGLYLGLLGGIAFLFGRRSSLQNYILEPIFRLGRFTLYKLRSIDNLIEIITEPVKFPTKYTKDDVIKAEVTKLGRKPLIKFAINERKMFVEKVLEAYEVGEGTEDEIVNKMGTTQALKKAGYKTFDKASYRSYGKWKAGDFSS